MNQFLADLLVYLDWIVFVQFSLSMNRNQLQVAVTNKSNSDFHSTLAMIDE